MSTDAETASERAATLPYADVPVRPYVERFEGGAKLVVPNARPFARLLAIEWGPMLPWIIGSVAGIAGLGVLVVWPIAQVPGGIAPLVIALVAVNVLTVAVMLLTIAVRARRMPTTTVLVWNGELLLIESAGFAQDQSGALAAGDPRTWSKAALADIELQPVDRPVPTGLTRVRIESRYDLPTFVGCYPAKQLAPVVAEFRQIVFAEEAA